MASGPVHRRDSVWAGVAIASAGLAHMVTIYHMTGEWPAYTVPVVNVVTGAMFTGRRIHSDWDYEQYVSWWIKPYAQIIPHRSFWSHGPIVGTLIRVVYCISMLFLAGWLALLAYSFVTTEYNAAQLFVMYVYMWIDYAPWPAIFWHSIGLAISDFVHFIADGTPIR